MNETHLSEFHFVSNRARGKCSRKRVSSAARYAFSSFFFCLTQESLRHSRYSTALQYISIHVFIAAGQILKLNKL